MLARARWEEQDSCRELKIKTGNQLEKGGMRLQRGFSSPWALTRKLCAFRR